MIKAIIFDCFGVLVTESWESFKHRYFKDQSSLDEASNIMDQSNAGFISHEQFLGAIAELARISPTEVEQELGGNKPNERLFELIYELSDDYKIALLSNVADDFLSSMFSKQQLGVFDEIALSYKIQAIKPDPKAYIKTAELLGCEPEQCVMVDDRESYVSGAEEVGMYAIFYDKHEKFEQQLSDLLKVANTDK